MEVTQRTAEETLADQNEILRSLNRLLGQLYAIMVDPIASGDMQMAEVAEALLKAAMLQREQLAAVPERIAAAKQDAVLRCLDLAVTESWRFPPLLEERIREEFGL